MVAIAVLAEVFIAPMVACPAVSKLEMFAQAGGAVKIQPELPEVFVELAPAYQTAPPVAAESLRLK